MCGVGERIWVILPTPHPLKAYVGTEGQELWVRGSPGEGQHGQGQKLENYEAWLGPQAVLPAVCAEQSSGRYSSKKVGNFL